MAPSQVDELAPIPDESGAVAGKAGAVLLDASDPACSVKVDETPEDEKSCWFCRSVNGFKFGGNRVIGLVGFCAASWGSCSGGRCEDFVSDRWYMVEVSGLAVSMRLGAVLKFVSDNARLFAVSSNNVGVAEECRGFCDIDVDGISKVLGGAEEEKGDNTEFGVAFASCSAGVVEEPLLERNCC